MTRLLRCHIDQIEGNSKSYITSHWRARKNGNINARKSQTQHFVAVRQAKGCWERDKESLACVLTTTSPASGKSLFELFPEQVDGCSSSSVKLYL